MRGTTTAALAGAVLAVFLAREAPATWVYSRDTGRFQRLESMAKDNALEQFKYAAEFERNGQWELAGREYRKVVRYYPDSILAPRAQFKVGESYEHLGKLSKAFDQYQLVLDKYPSFSDPDEVIKRQFAIASAFYGGRRKSMPLMGFRLLSGKAEAIRLYEQLALNAPFSPVAEESKYRAGELLERKKHYDDYTTMDKGTRTGAINTYLFVVDNFDEGQRRDDALYRVGECYYKKARRARYDKKAIEQALLYYRRSQREYPKGEHVEAVKQRIAELDHRRAEGLFEVARYYEQRRKFRAALLYYDDLTKRFPLSPYVEQAEERAGALRQRVTASADEVTKDPGEDVVGPGEMNE
jgi:outer membrane protein assembly factor BamD